MGLLDLIPGLGTLRALGIGLMVAGACSTVAGLAGFAKGKAADKQRSDLVISNMVRDHNAAMALASENYRRSEADWRAQVDAARTLYTERQAQHETELASVRAARAADAGRLRIALAALAASGGASAPDPAASAGDCAATAGQLLETGLRVQADLAAGAESAADAYRAMREAWPVK